MKKGAITWEYLIVAVIVILVIFIVTALILGERNLILRGIESFVDRFFGGA